MSFQFDKLIPSRQENAGFMTSWDLFRGLRILVGFERDDWLIDWLMIVPALSAAPGGLTCRRMLSTRRPWKTGPLALPLTLENYNKLQTWNFVNAGNVFTERRAEVTVTLKSRSSIFSSSKRKRLNSILWFHNQSSCCMLSNHRRRQRQRGIKRGCLHSDC